MYIPMYFTPKELFPPKISDPELGKFDIRNWMRFDERILKMFDQIRGDHGPITGNEGSLTGCGYRIGDGLSQHFHGRGIDGHPKKAPVFDIRKAIILNRDRYPHIRFLEVDITWLHGDCGNRRPQNVLRTDGILLWSPKRGYVDIDDYLAWGDK